MADIADLLRYFAEVVQWGDYINKYLWKLPDDIQIAAQALGEWLAQGLGY